MRARLIALLAIVVWGATPGFAQEKAPAADSAIEQARKAYPAARMEPRSQKNWEQLTNEVEKDAPGDEAYALRGLDGKVLRDKNGDLVRGPVSGRGTPLKHRIAACFPTEARNLFADVDMVAGSSGKLEPMNYSTNGIITAEGRKAIQGQNTWILWGEGNEAFWGWLQENGYGLSDFLILIDSRNRGRRFHDVGLVNQPGMKAQLDPAKKILGLYIDQADGDRVLIQQPKTDIDSTTGKLATPVRPPRGHPTEFFEIGDQKLYDDTVAKLAKDGIDPMVYGYPSGVVGLRLFLNPDFFGKTPAAEQAREYWKSRVIQQDDLFYTDAKIHADPKLVRPFRISMSCGFCHVGPHPLNPPRNPEEPEWANISSMIGGQYWTPDKTFSNLKKPDSFLWQFIASQQPGTIDTSLVSTDHINNSNTITSVFEVPGRIDRAKKNPREQQSAANMLQTDEPINSVGEVRRLTPRVLIDGADSIGVTGALSRVYLNIGTYSEQWKHLHNPVIGFKPQRPFALKTILEKSIYWQTAEEFRIPQLRSFFTFRNEANGTTVSQAMKLAHAPGGKAIIAVEAASAAQGRDVFLKHCAVCHSSKQPDDFKLTFSRDWTSASSKVDSATLMMPMDYTEWEDFKASKAYAAYVDRIVALAGKPGAAGDDFVKSNYLSTDIRVPVTLVGTNSGRAVATNGMRGQMWDNFSSDDYKDLPSVGAIRFYNPYLKDKEGRVTGVDKWGNNDAYAPPGNGPGYYRPASLASLWATAPYFHNNALGHYTHDPSVNGRLVAFNDAIDKILSKANRKPSETSRPGDLRLQITSLKNEQGFIYRTTARSWIDIPRTFVKQLLHGILGEGLSRFLTLYVWVLLAAVAILLLVLRQATRYASVVAFLIFLATAVITSWGGFYKVDLSLLLVPATFIVLALVFWQQSTFGTAARIFLALLAAAFLLVGGVATAFVDGKLGDLRVGPIPKGTPVNLIMNINPEGPTLGLIEAGFGMVRGILRISKHNLSDANGDALAAFEDEAGLALMKASKCPDFVLDRGHWFAEDLSEEEKLKLKAFLKTL